MSGTAPLFSLVPKSDRHEYERLRGIENEYQLEMVAENARQLVQYHASALRVQAGQAARTLRNFAVMLNGHSSSNMLVEGVECDMSALVDGMDRLTGDSHFSTDFAQMALTPPPNGDPSTGLQGTLIEFFERLAKYQLREQKDLRKSGERARLVYEAQALELRIEAEKWLLSGMKRVGRDRDEDFKDALRLLRDVVDGPGGMQDYVAWFQIGWLLWKHQNNIPEAEDAFYRAQRLSADGGDIYYIKSLRHLAYAQHLQGHHGEAYDTIQKALGVDADHDTRFDAARYAANRGYTDECLALLEQCIRERPTTVIAMFTELDFLRGSSASRIVREMANLASRMLIEARERADETVEHWEKALELVRLAEREAGLDTSMPATLNETALDAIPDVEDIDYLMALEIERKALTNGDHTLAFARDTLRTEVQERVQTLAKVQAELNELKFLQSRGTVQADDWRDDKIATMPTLTNSLREGGLGLNALFLLSGILLEIVLIPVAKAILGVKTGMTGSSILYTDIYMAYLGVAWLVLSYGVFLGAFIVDSILRIFRLRAIENEYHNIIAAKQQEIQRGERALKEKARQAEAMKARAEAGLKILERE